jgi:ABC-type transport system involved in cytochrome bd biosynthesis fused ATPase/permease subunit
MVVADEPTAELDQASDRALIDVIVSLRGVSFVVATHDPLVWRRASEVIELSHGRRRERGIPRVREKAAPPPPQQSSVSRTVVLHARGVTKSYPRGG